MGGATGAGKVSPAGGFEDAFATVCVMEFAGVAAGVFSAAVSGLTAGFGFAAA
jgi:hypothetical protein